VGATGVVATLAPRTRAHKPDPAPYALMWAFVRRPGIAPWLGLLAAYKAGESFGVSVVRSFLVDRGLGIEAIGLVLGVGGFAAGLVGALVGGLVAGRVGARRALIGFAGLQAVAVACYAVPAGGLGGVGAVVVAALFEHFASGTATAAVFTAMMDASSKKTAATDYTVQACVVVLSTILAGAASGASAKALGYPLHFLFAAALCWVVVALAAGVRVPRLAAVNLA
jgi:predicted MFS family arabinose efflux permease